MNYKTIVLIGFFTIGSGLYNIKSVNAYDSSVKPSVTTDYTLIDSQPSSFKISQIVTEASSPLYVNWKLEYSIDGILYESILRMEGYSGTMRTKYFNALINQTDVIDQTMELKSSSQGLILLGSNPVDANTKIPDPTYIPDNFLFQIRPNGSFVVITCDRNSRCSDVDLAVVR
ncbi:MULTISPECIES: hypothetical protein [Nostoc]|uniref:Uncharacterized protein n=1 Tax=Nostoc paludosum FACHB-159 TaxID=2692908 RepID=A0ABR8K1L9_9NOSO|nr:MULTISPECIES: hypothetical protein [Nostoc]MBD2677111.1 hypothetical protein [Nostoc sp. FACHB-857]MBD2733310.1 hypothetical protein [Nostoc paludosum FACHB-159]